jgi:FkbM family methyltransferase
MDVTLLSKKLRDYYSQLRHLGSVDTRINQTRHDLAPRIDALERLAGGLGRSIDSVLNGDAVARIATVEKQTAELAQSVNSIRDGSLATRIDALERQAAELAQSINSVRDSVDRMTKIVDYATVRDVALVGYNQDYYYWYRTEGLLRKYVGEGRARFVEEPEVEAATAERKSRWGALGGTADQLPQIESVMTAAPFTYTVLHPFVLHLARNVPEACIIDVGANVGVTAIPFARILKDIGRHISIHSFEPGPTAPLLEANVRLNGHEDVVRVVQKAVSDTEGVAPMRAMAGYSESSSLINMNIHYAELILAHVRLVETVTLDSYAKTERINQPLYVKIDAEARDTNVVRGAQSLLKSGQVRAVSVEVQPRYMPKDDFLEMMKSLPPVVFNLRKFDADAWFGYQGVVEQGDLSQFYEEVRTSPHGWTDLLCMDQQLASAERFTERVLTWRH